MNTPTAGRGRTGAEAFGAVQGAVRIPGPEAPCRNAVAGAMASGPSHPDHDGGACTWYVTRKATRSPSRNQHRHHRRSWRRSLAEYHDDERGTDSHHAVSLTDFAYITTETALLCGNRRDGLGESRSRTTWKNFVDQGIRMMAEQLRGRYARCSRRRRP